MNNTEKFSVSLECEVYLMEDSERIGESSSIVPGEFIGWTSITSDDFDLSDDDVYKLLEVSHIKEEFARKLLDLCFSVRQMRKFNQKNSGSRFVMKDIWISGHISEKYLNSIGDEDVIDKLKNYNEEIRIISE